MAVVWQRVGGRSAFERSRARRVAGAAALLAIAAGLAGCGGGPNALLEMSWGDDATVSAQRHGGCQQWVPWRGSDIFEQCQLGPLELYDLESYVWLYRAGEELEGMALWFPDCTGHEEELIARIWVGELELDPAERYITWGDGEVARFERTDQPDARYSCTLTLADDAFGQAYSSQQLGFGLSL